MTKLLILSFFIVTAAHAATPDANFIEKMDFNKCVEIKEKEIVVNKFDSDRSTGKDINNRSPSIETDHRKRRASKQ